MHRGGGGGLSCEAVVDSKPVGSVSRRYWLNAPEVASKSVALQGLAQKLLPRAPDCLSSCEDSPVLVDRSESDAAHHFLEGDAFLTAAATFTGFTAFTAFPGVPDETISFCTSAMKAFPSSLS